MNPIRPRLLVLGWIGSTNLGDELIAEAVCELVVEAGGEPTVVTIDEAASRRLGVPTVRHAGPHDAAGLARAVRDHDAVIFGGGGLLQDETGPLNLPFHLSRLATGRLLRRPWAGVGLGVGAVRRRSGRALVRATLRGAVAVSVRDQASADRYRDLTGTDPTVAADPVVARSPSTVAATDHLVVSLRRANMPGQRRLRSSAPPADARVRRWAEVIDAVAASRGLAVRFVAWERDQDHALHQSVASLLRTPSVLETPGSDDIIERMGAGRCVLTMRYHGAIAALLHGRPTVVLDYSPKMNDLVSEADGGLALVAVEASPAEVARRLDEVLDLSDRRTGALASLRERASANATVVARLVEAARQR